MMFVVHLSAPVKRPVPTEGMIERRNQILGMNYGMRSLSFLLEEKKFRECGLVGETEFTGDWLIPKYSKWQSVLVPYGY